MSNYGIITIKMKEGGKYTYSCLQNQISSIFTLLQEDWTKVEEVNFKICDCATFNSYPLYSYTRHKNKVEFKDRFNKTFGEQLPLFRIC